MKSSDKKAMYASSLAEWDSLPLNDEERKILKERFLKSGDLRMTYEAIASMFGLTVGRTQRIVERAMAKLEAYAQEKQRRAEAPQQTQMETREQDDIYPSSRPFKPFYRHLGNDELETLDIVFAAALMAQGHEFVSIRDPNGTGFKKRIILRVSPQDADQALSDFMAQRFMVDASVYHGRLKALKNALYNSYNSSSSYAK